MQQTHGEKDPSLSRGLLDLRSQKKFSLFSRAFKASNEFSSPKLGLAKMADWPTAVLWHVQSRPWTYWASPSAGGLLVGNKSLQSLCEAFNSSQESEEEVSHLGDSSPFLPSHDPSPYLSASKGVFLSAPTTGVLHGGDLKVSSNSFFMGKTHQVSVLVREKHGVGHFRCVSEENTNLSRACFPVSTKELSASWPLFWACNNTGKLFAMELGRTNLV